MSDPRLERYAELICERCLEIRPGQRLVIHAPPAAGPLVLEIARAAFARGGHAGVVMETPASHETLLRHGSPEQLREPDPWLAELMEQADASVGILAEHNTRALSSVPPERSADLQRSFASIAARVFARYADGSLLWCGCAFPTAAAAQDAQMGTLAFERFVYDACLLDETDPAAAWAAVEERQARLIERLAAARELRVRAPGTDLRVTVAGRAWENAAGQRNLPDGEVFCCPDLGGTNGEITFTIPAYRDGRRFDGVRLRFEDGVVVDASAREGEAALLELLDTDEGARRIGELGIGTNERIRVPTGSTLFDEKIVGTCHLALGQAFPHLGGTNASAIHWDLVCDLRSSGTIEADGEPILRDGGLVV